jgi:hypothetical protein
MSKKQTRRSISVSGETYDRLQAHIKVHGNTCSGIVEDQLRVFFGLPERTQKEVIAPIPRFQRKTAANGFRDAPARQAQVGDPLLGKAREVKISTPVLEKNGDWVEKGPADRIQAIKDVVEAKAEEPKSPELLKKLDAASKIFTF